MKWCKQKCYLRKNSVTTLAHVINDSVFFSEYNRDMVHNNCLDRSFVYGGGWYSQVFIENIHI